MAYFLQEKSPVDFLSQWIDETQENADPVVLVGLGPKINQGRKCNFPNLYDYDTVDGY